jgi:hypothetical protein
MGGVTDWVGDQLSDTWDGITNFTRDPIGQTKDWMVEPFKATISRPLEWFGDTIGVNEISDAGGFLTENVFDDPWFKRAVLAAATYGAGAMASGGEAVGSLGDWAGSFGDWGGGAAEWASEAYPTVAGWSEYAGQGGAAMEDMLYGIDYGGLGDMYGGSWLGNLGTDMYSIPGYETMSGLGDYLPSMNSVNGLSSWAKLLGLGGTNLLGQYYGARQQQKGADDAFSKQLAAQQAYQNTQRTDIANAQNQALQNWMQYGFPSQGAVQAGIDAGKGAIKQAGATAGHSLDETLAGRGFAPGSGAIAGEYGKLARSQVSDIGKLTNQMTQFGLTPYSAPPITMAYPGMPSVPGYAQPLSFGERAADMLGGITGTMGGLYTYDWLKNR